MSLMALVVVVMAAGKGGGILIYLFLDLRLGDSFLGGKASKNRRLHALSLLSSYHLLHIPVTTLLQHGNTFSAPSPCPKQDYVHTNDSNHPIIQLAVQFGHYAPENRLFQTHK